MADQETNATTLADRIIASRAATPVTREELLSLAVMIKVLSRTCDELAGLCAIREIEDPELRTNLFNHATAFQRRMAALTDDQFNGAI